MTAASLAWGPLYAFPGREIRTVGPVQVPGYGVLPLRFEPNVGQMGSGVEFVSRAAGHDLFLTRREAMLAVRGGGRPLRIGLVRGQ